MTNEEAKYLLDRYLIGECTPNEEAKLNAWYESLAQQNEFKWKDGEKDLINHKLKQAIDASILIKRGRVINLKSLLVAASIAAVCLVGFLLGRNQTLFKLPARQIVYKETTVPAGQKMKLTLSDGSSVILNGCSKIRYPDSFDQKIREVTLLEGEAFFDIKHDNTKPFIVKARDTKITVLGTAFNVRAYKFLKSVQVTVTRGKVSVNDEKNYGSNNGVPVVLTPDEQVTIATATGTTPIKKHIRSGDVIGWVQGRYLFDNETLVNVGKMLESYFKVQVTFSNEELKNIRFTSEFENTDKLEDILFAICKANNISYTINGQIILFSEKN